MGRKKMFVKTVKFDGKNYTLYKKYVRALDVNRDATKLRKKGWNARTVHKKEFGVSWYALYRRKRR